MPDDDAGTLPATAGAGASAAPFAALDLMVEGGLPYRLKHCRHGWFLYNVRDYYIGRSLDLYGEYSEDELEFLLRLVRPGELVLEAGANIGTHAVPMARHLGARGTLFAFEPQRMVHQLLCANIALNGLPNVVTMPVGLGAEAGRAVVPPFDHRRVLNLGGVTLQREGQGEGVEIRTIDGLRLRRCRLIKLDVESMELEVLRGATETIRRLRPILYVENSLGEYSAPLIAHIMALGYRLWWHLPMLYRARNFAGNQENVFVGTASANMLCLPPGDASAVHGLREITRSDDPPPIERA